MPVAARHLAAVPRPATRKKVDSITRVTLSRDFRVVWENSVGTDALVRPQRDSAAGKNSFGISIPASVGRLRNQSYALVIASEAWQSHGNEMPPTCPRGLRAPRRLTAAKKRFARFCRENRFSIYVIAFLRREPLISVSCGYTYSAFTAACFRDRSRFLSLPKPFTSVPATAENRVVFYKTKKTG